MPRLSRPKTLYMATSNRHKLREARSLLKDFDLKVKMIKVKTHEIQHDDIRAIAVTAVREAVKTTEHPVLVEDAGLFVRELKGFPGPYSSYIFRILGLNGVLRLLEGRKDREAEFRSVVAYGEPSGEINVFTGAVKGDIRDKPRGIGGFGFDPIFIPKGGGKTFGEMTLKEKNLFSHRAESLRRFCSWYTKATEAWCGCESGE